MADISQLEVNGTTYDICDATARDSLSQYLPLTGGNVSGTIKSNHNFIIKVEDQDRDGEAPSADQYSSDSANAAFRLVDKDDGSLVWIRAIRRTTGGIEWNLMAHNANESGTGNVYGGSITGGVKRDGSTYYTVGNQQAFRTAINAVSKSGDTVTGFLAFKSTNLDRDGSDPSSNTNGDAVIQFTDNNDEYIGRVNTYRLTDGTQRTYLQAFNEKSDGTTATCNLSVGVKKDGSPEFRVTNAPAFRDGLGASSGVWPVSVGGTGATTAANARTNLGLGETAYSGSNVITVASGYTLETNTNAIKRAGVVATNIGIKTTAAYTAGTLVKVGTLVVALRPKYLTPFIMWQTAWSIGYIETDGSVYIRLGVSVSANSLLGWARLSYMTSTI